MQIRLLAPYFLALLVLAPLLLVWLRRSPRPLSAGRRRLLMGLRGVVLVLVVGALVRVSLTQPSQRSNVVFVLDVSHSVPPAVQQEALAFIREVSEGKRPEDGVGVVLFGTDAFLEHAVSGRFRLAEPASEVERGATHIARGMAVGLASFPAAGSRRLVLLSDGNENVGSAAEAALVAASLGVQVFPLPLGQPPGEPEVRVEGLQVPAQVRMGTPYRVEAVIFSSHATTAMLDLFRGGALSERRQVDLAPGKNRFRFLQTASTEGVQLYQLVANSPLDTLPDNNRWQAFTEVVGAPKLLLVYDVADHSTFLVEALHRQGLAVQTRPWGELPQGLSAYLEYDAVIFDNVPGFGISMSQMEVLERYVRDMGGGVLMLGGEKSFGAGGYYRTPLERLLPVDMDVPTKLSIPSLCLVMVIDKSDSMGGSISGGEPIRRFEDRTTKLEVAKIAAFSAMKLLNPLDQVGLLAFNADWEWTVPISEAGRREQIAGRLSALLHGGGTDLFKALDEGLRVLKEVKAVKKHLIALSDGLTPNMNFEALMRDAVAHNISVTTVALGKDADQTLMAAIAHWGKGRSYYTDDPLYIPRIFTAETILVSRGLLEEQPFQPVLQTEHELLRGLQMDQSPPLYGYVVTYGKPAAELLLVTATGDPVLAVQRYGLGRTAAFTSDLSQRWGKDWLRWAQLPQFAAQLVRWIQRQGTDEGFDVRVEVREGQAIVEADVYDAEGRFVNNLGLQGRVITAGRDTLTVPFSQLAPGRYQGRFPVQGTGEYLLSLVGKQGETGVGPKTVGIALPYSAEYLGLDTNYGLLNGLAERTGGQVLRLQAPQEAAPLLFSHPGPHFSTLRDYWPWFATLALCLFVIEVAVRQMLTPAGGWQRGGRRRQPPREPAPSYTYGDMEAIVHRRVEEHRRRSLTFRDSSPAAEAGGEEQARRFYMAGLRHRKRRS